MRKTKLQQNNPQQQNHVNKTIRKETVEQLSKNMPAGLNRDFVEELEKKLRDLFTQLRLQVELLQRINALALSQTQLFNLDHPRAERAIAQRQLVLSHEVLRFLPFAAVHVKQHDAVYGMVFLKHRLNSGQSRVGQYVFYLLLFSTFLCNHSYSPVFHC